MRGVPGLIAALGLAMSAAPGAATSATLPLARASDLAELSLEQLSEVVVTSVSRRPEPLAAAPASIYVISGEEIRRSGATSLPEALRLAPNLDVARIDRNQFAISARGFNDVFANKMLVLIDGRAIYTPLFSGVFWEVQDVLLEDVDRIEVISGPGAVQWGANAVNGVINVITRAPAESQGLFATGHAGTEERGAALRHGGQLGASGQYRAYVKFEDRDHTGLERGGSARDASDRAQTGFRLDWASAIQRVTLQGDAYYADIDQMPDTRAMSGMNILARWLRTLGDGSRLRLQAYYDRTERDHRTIAQTLDTIGLDFQHTLPAWGRHNLLWGGGYRQSRDDVRNGHELAFFPDDRTLEWVDLFVQDRIALHETLDLVLGAKLEHNDYSGADFMPSVRLGWRPVPGQFFWGAVSRAARAPSRFDRDLFLPGVPPFVVAGGPDFESETATIYELGHRAQPRPALSYAITVFHHAYDRLRSIEPLPGGARLLNRIEGSIDGLELWGAWHVLPWWRLSAGGVLMSDDLDLDRGSASIGGTMLLGNDPGYWLKLRSMMDLGPRHRLDLSLRHYGERPAPAVAAYAALDARLAWDATPRLEVSLLLRNLTDGGHVEWGMPGLRSELERAAILQLRWIP